MNRYIVLFLLFIVGLPAAASSVENTSNTSSSQSSTSQLQLSAQEKVWIKEHPVLRVAPDPDFPPMEFFDSQGRYQGMVADYMRLVAERLGVRIEAVRTKSWTHALEALESGKADLIPANVPGEENRKQNLFSNSYYGFPDVILTHDGIKGAVRLEDLAGKKVLVVKGWPEVETLKNDYPQVEAVEVENTLEGLMKVAFREYDYFFGYLPTTTYFVRENAISGVRVAALVGEPVNASVMVPKTSPLLLGLVNKALASITPDEHRKIGERWGSGLASSAQLLSWNEQAWLKKHPVIKVANDKEWAPFDFFENGRAKGYSMDYLRVLADIIGLKLEFVQDSSWDKLIKQFEANKIDIITAYEDQPENKQHALFTEPYLETFESIIIRKDRPFLSNYKDLYGKKVAVIRGYDYEDEINKNHPEIEMVLVDSPVEGLKKVQYGEAVALLENSAVADYLIKKHGFSNLMLAGDPSLPGMEEGDKIAIAVRKDWPELHSMLSKAMKVIPENRLMELNRRWLGHDVNKMQQRIVLSEKEQAFLKENPVIKVSNETNWPPFDFAINGQPQGYMVDLLNLLAQRIGIKLEYITSDSWSELQEKFKQGELDILQSVNKTPERKTLGLFSEPLYQYKNYFIIKKGAPNIESIQALSGKRIAVPKGWSYAEYLKANHPDITVVRTKDTLSAFKAVINGDADATIESYPVADFIFTKNFISELKISGWFKSFDLFTSQKLHLMAHFEQPELISMFNKAITLLTLSELKALEGKWIGEKPVDRQFLQLTSEEEAWLMKHPVIRVHNEKDWPPFNYHEQGQPRGFSIDYMNLLAEKLGIEVEYRTGPSWNEFLQQIKAKELDVMLNIIKTEDRMKYLLYTETYVKNPNVIVSRTDAPIRDISELNGRTVAFPKGFFYEEVLTKGFPEIKRLPVEDTLASLKAVASGKADAALGEDAVVRHQIIRNFISNIQVTGMADIGNPDMENLRIGVRDDWPLFHSAINKAMAQVSPGEMLAINKRWLSMAAKGTPVTEVETGLTLKGLVIVLIQIILVLLITIYILRRTGSSLVDKVLSGRNLPYLTAGLVAAFLVVAMLAAWQSLERMEKQLRVEVGKNLASLNNSVRESLQLWESNRARDLHHLSDDFRILPVAEALLALPRNTAALLKSDALSEVRKLYDYHNKDIGALGFFIIAPDGVSLASSRDGNVGSRNLIVEQQPELMKRVFAGESVFVPPIFSDVPLKDASGKLVARAATMFFASPLRDDSGKVIAALTLRFDPVEEFSFVSGIGRSGETGETYAFDRNGRLLTASRFQDHSDLLNKVFGDRQELLSMQLRDPGGDLTEGYQPENDRSNWPLTLVAKEAIAGHDGLNIDGYRDYRGVHVLGAWSWSEEFGVGLATEIDELEALNAYQVMRKWIMAIVGGIAVVMLLITAFSIWIGERARSRLTELVDLRTNELQESEKRVLTILETAPDSIITITDKGIVESFNPASERVFGYMADEVIGQNISMLMPEPHKSEHDDHITRYLKTGKKRVIGQIRVVEGMRKDGSSFPIELKVSEMIQGESRAFIGMLQDISARKEAEEKIQAAMHAAEEAEQQTRLLLESVGEGIFGVDVKGHLTFINPAGAAMLGYTPEEMVGERVHPLIHHTRVDGSDYPVEECLMYQSFTAGITGTRDDEVLWRKDGSSFPMLYNSVPVMDAEGELVGAVIVFLDITARKQAEETAEEASLELQTKLDELERFQKMAVGRELKMIELKKEINKKLQENGEPPKYKIVSLEQDEDVS